MGHFFLRGVGRRAVRGLSDFGKLLLSLLKRKKRVGLYVDGFNLYHAIADLNKPHLKWLDLRALAERLIDRRDERLLRVVFCSAYPTHLNDAKKLERHQDYIAALEARGVECYMGQFKKRPVTRCRSCNHAWQTHEEKESDVMLALQILHDAHLDRVDQVYLLSGDSDFASLARLFREEFPNKKFFSVSPPRRPHSKEVLQHAHGKRRLRLTTLEKCLLPSEVQDARGRILSVRPVEYDPPS
ncbi:MAG: NYN domain-containing protein [Alphaproteobacteria bacterium]|nr:MAG: NYN domain-containing protein [Alphaproteobacteria bacterium]